MSVNISYKDTLHAYSVSPAMLVQDLMEEISEEQFLYQFKLKYGDIDLLTDMPASKYLLTQLTLCYDDKEVPVEINDVTFDVSMTTPDGVRSVTEKASAEMTIEQFKERISTKFISTQANWVLKKQGQVVPDKDLLKSHMDKKTFTVVLEDMNVHFKTPNCTFTIQTRCDTTILQFKQICAEKTNMDMEEMNLSFNGEILETHMDIDEHIAQFIEEKFGIDMAPIIAEEMEKKKTVENRTLGSYRIKHQDVVTFVASLKGG